MTARSSKRGVVLERCFQLAALLATGTPLDRNVVASALKTSHANADRYLQAIIATMKVSVRQRGRMKIIQAALPEGTQPLNNATAAAVCIAASLARFFQKNAIGERMNKAVEKLLFTSPNASLFSERERQFIFIARGGERALHSKGSTRLDIIIDAILKRQKLRLRYRRFNGTKAMCLMSPLSLVLHEHQLYVLGDVQGGMETIRFSRIHAALKMKDTFKYPDITDYDPKKLFSDSLGIFIKDDADRGMRVCNVKIRLTKEWLPYVQSHRWHHSQRHRRDGDGVILEFRLRTCHELDRLILGFGPDAEVLAPADLRERVGRRAAQLAQLYAK